MLRDDIADFINAIPNNVSIVAATKYVSKENIKEYLDAKLFNLGENRADSFIEKYLYLNDKRIIWHFIGHLQRNKAKDVIPKIDYLHSLDSLELAKLIRDYRDKPLKVFVEVNLNNEESKSGISSSNALNFIKEIKDYNNLDVIGLMTMTRANDTKENIFNTFKELHLLKNKINLELGISLTDLSMGMSDDYLIAIENNSTFIRLGRILLK